MSREEDVYDLRHALTTGVQKVRGKEDGRYFVINHGTWTEVRSTSEWARTILEAKSKIGVLIDRRRAALRREEAKLKAIGDSTKLPMKIGHQQ